MYKSLALPVPSVSHERTSSSSSSSYSSPLSCSPQTIRIMKVHDAAARATCPLQISQRAYFSLTVMAVTSSIISYQGSSSQEKEGPSTPQALLDTGSLFRDAIEDKVAELVEILLLKYRTKDKSQKQKC